MYTVDVCNRAGLAKLFDAECCDAVAKNAAQPGQSRRVPIENRDDVAITG